MHVKSKVRKLKVAGLIILMILMLTIILLLCYGAYSPHQLLPQGFRWGIYPIPAGGEDYPLTAGGLAIVDTQADPELGAMALRQEGGRNLFGRIIAMEEGQYTLRLRSDGQPFEIDVSHPHRVVYHIAGLGGFVLFLHTYRIAVWISSLTLVLACTIYYFTTAKKRRMKKIRAEYIRIFDEHGQKFDPDEEY